MRCLLDTLGFSSNPLIKTSKKKFKNCAIIELVVEPTKMKIKMIHEGDLAGEDSDADKYFSDFEAELQNNPFSTEGNTFIFYIMRHGDGKHNEAKQKGFLTKTFQVLSQSLYDAELTERGKDQGFNAGVAFTPLKI
jgi:hypothetical protein